MADYSACQLRIELGYEEAAEFGDDSSVRPMERLSSRIKSSSAGDFFVFIEFFMNNFFFMKDDFSICS